MWASEAKIGSVKLERADLGKNEKCELTVEVAGAVKNPFDPDEIALDAIFRPPHGDAINVPGFFYQPYERVIKGTSETTNAAGEPVWKIRFTPRQTGRWSVTVRVSTPSGAQVSPPQTFNVRASQQPGFLIADRQTGGWRYDNGEPFVPVGENVCWGPGVGLIKAYDEWLGQLAKEKANYIRVWLAPWALRLETKETRVGHYDQLRAWQLDQLLEMSERQGIYWQLCMLNHGAFSRTQDPDWQNNPYNEALGGMCALPSEFMTKPAAKKMFQRMLRYLVARYGYSPHLATWELFNEADFGEFKYPEIESWTKETSEYLRHIDPYAHAITTSFHHETAEGTWKLPTIDTIQIHTYELRDFVDAFTGSMVSKPREAFHKPVMVGEFGWINDFVRQFDRQGIHLHDGMWAGLMGGAAGAPMIWYWDTYVAPNHLERHFLPIVRFWKGEPWPRGRHSLSVVCSNPDLVGRGYGTSDRSYLWLKNRTHNLDQYLAYRCALAKQQMLQDRGESSPLVQYPPAIVEGATITVKDMPRMSRYRVEWWDTYRGRIVSQSVARVDNGTLTLPVPPVKFDVAAKLVRMSWWKRS